ncbi:MAG: cell division protein YceG involved in septum cleavage, partial [Gammaproteobacteria bacterium]
MKRAFAIIALGLVAIFGCGAFAGYQWVERELGLPLNVPADATFIVPPGQNLRSIAQTLERRGWIEYPQLLVGWGRW